MNQLHQMRLEKGGQGTWHRWRAFGDRSLREKEVLPHTSQSTRWNKTSGSENRSPIHRLDQGVTPVPGLRTWKGKRELERGWPSHRSCVSPHSDVTPCLSLVMNEECLHTRSHRYQRRSFVEHCLVVDLPRSCMVLYLQREGSGRSEQRHFLLVLRKMAHSAARQQRSSADAAPRLTNCSSRPLSY